MSDPKRGTLITVGAPNSVKKIVNKTVRLTINLVESNESKYPELNYKELVIAAEKKKRLENGKTPGLDPFSDNDDDVERVARKFEQKYGGKSTYGKKKSRSKQDDFADIGAGYDENDSFIDNTHGYDEMIPPECDTLHGGFYINCGSLEFKSVEHTGTPDEPRRNKRRISSSSSEEESSDSSSDSESDEKDKPITNGTVHSHDTEHRKKKNKKDKQKAKKVRTDSSAATSGKQTSDDNNHADAEGESVDSRTSHSDSLTSKPAPSSENAITSDSSRDVDTKMDTKLPAPVTQVLDALESSIAKYLIEHPTTPATQLLANNDTHIQRLEQTLKKCGCNSRVTRLARNHAARALGVSRAKLLQRTSARDTAQAPPTTESAQPTTAPSTVPTAAPDHKRKLDEEDELDVTTLSDDLREAQILNTLKRLMDLIEEKKPSMFANYNLECERVREEKKKLTSDGASHVEKRLPKRRFPWCHRSRSLLARLTALAGSQQAGAALLADKVLPMFPKGFVRMPTLMRQANINKDIKVPEMKRQRLGSASHLNHAQPLNHVPTTAPTTPVFPDQIQFPSSLTVTATLKSPEKEPLGYIMNSFSLNKDLIVEKEDKKEDYRKEDKKKEEVYIPPNSIGSITITPVPNKEKKPDKNAKPETKSLIRVKSPAALNESVKTKKDTKPITNKRLENPISNTKDKRIETLPVKDNKEVTKDKKNEPLKDKRIEPLQIDTSFSTAKKEPSPKTKEDLLSQKQIESLRVKENNIPRPALVPVTHSPTFAKPDKRPPEIKKKKDEKTDSDFKKKDEKIDTDVQKKDEKVMIVSDLDPLADQEPVAIDDSSSDVEVIENDKCEVPLRDKVIKSVPKTSVSDGGDVDIVMRNVSDMKGKVDDPTEEDIDVVMRNIREMESSQETTKFSSNSFGPVVLNAQNEML